MRNMFDKSIVSSLSLALLLGIAGCGGGSSDTAGSISSAFSGVGIDGILVGSTVCVDVNGNGSCDTGEPSDTTDDQGKFTIPETRLTGPLLLVGGTDKSTGQDFTGSLKAPAGSTVVTPLTSAVQSLVESGKSAADAEKNVKAAMGLTGNNDVNLTSFDPYAEINGANATKAQAVLAKQTQLQVLVHSATVTVAGADANTDVNSTMSSVFDAIAENFNGATGTVTLDADTLTAATKKAADKVYETNPKAKVAAKVVAQTSAENSVRDADAADKAISEGTPAEATGNLDAAITKVNTSAETELRALAEQAKIEADKLDTAKIAEIEDLQKAQQEKEAEIAAAKAAQAKAEADLATAKAAAEADAVDRVKYEAFLAAQAAAEKAAAEKAAADEAAAFASKLAAEQEKLIAAAEAAQRQAEAEAAEAQAAAEKAEAEARQAAAEKASADAKAATDLTAAQQAAVDAQAAAATAIAQAKVNTNVQIANFYVVQAKRDANATRILANTFAAADANATTAEGARDLAIIAAHDTNVTITTDINASLSLSKTKLDATAAQAAIAAAALEDAYKVKAEVELAVAAKVALQAKIGRITKVLTDVNSTKNAAQTLYEVNATSIKNVIDSNMNAIGAIASNPLYPNAQAKFSDANASAQIALKAYNDANASLILINQAYVDATSALVDRNETAVADAQVIANAEKTKLDGSFKIANEQATKILGIKAEVEAIKTKVDKEAADKAAGDAAAEAARVKAAIQTSKTTAQASLDTALAAITSAQKSASDANASAQAAGIIAASNSNAQTAATTAATAAQTAGTQANEAGIAAKLAGDEMTKVFVTNVADINESTAAAAATLIAEYTSSAVDAKNNAATAASTAAAQLVIAQNATPPVVEGAVTNLNATQVAQGMNTGTVFASFDQDNGKVSSWKVTLESNGTLNENQFVLNKSTGSFDADENATSDYFLNGSGNWEENIGGNYTLDANGIATIAKTGEKVKIAKVFDLVNPTTADDNKALSDVQKFIRDAFNDNNLTVDVNFTTGSQAYQLAFQNTVDSYTLGWQPKNCTDYNNTTNQCNVTATPYSSLLEYMLSNNDPYGSEDASGQWHTVGFEKTASSEIKTTNTNLTSSSTLSTTDTGNLVDKNATVVGTWKVITLPNTSSLAIELTPDITNHASAFSYPEETLVAVRNGTVYRGSAKKGSSYFIYENGVEFNDAAYTSIKTWLTGKLSSVAGGSDTNTTVGGGTSNTGTGSEISYSDFTTIYKPLMPHLRSDNIYFFGGNTNGLASFYFAATSEPRVSDLLYGIGAHPKYSYEVTTYQYSNTTLAQNWFSSYDLSYLVDYGTMNISVNNNILSYNDWNNDALSVKFSKPISTTALAQMYSDVGFTINFDNNDKAQFMLQHYADGNTDYLRLVVNESAYLKIKSAFIGTIAVDPVEPTDPTTCQNVNPITGACEDPVDPVEPTDPTTCQNVNPITGACED